LLDLVATPQENVVSKFQRKIIKSLVTIKYLPKISMLPKNIVWSFSSKVTSDRYFQLEGCYYASIGVWAHEPKILHTYVIGVYTLETVYNYMVYML